MRDMEIAEDFRQGEHGRNSGNSKHFDTVWQRQEYKHCQIVQLSKLKCLGIWGKTDINIMVNGQLSCHSLE